MENPLEAIENVEKHSTPLPCVGVFHKDKVIAAFKPILKNQTRRIKVQNLTGSKSMVTKGFKLIGRPTPSDQGELSVLDISFLTYANHLDVTDKEYVIEAIQRWIEKNKLLKDVHIINLTETKDSISSSVVQRGLNFTTPGHLYEIHPEEESGILPTSQFRFEGAFL